MTEKVDRRIQRTKNLLRKSILALVLERGYEVLTIEDITEHANLGRTTFYLHYKDKKELLLDSLNEIIEDVFQTIYSAENLKKWEEEGIDPRKILFTYAAENADLFRLLFHREVGGFTSGHFQQELSKIFIGLTENLQSHFKLTPQIPNIVTANFIAGALTGTLIWWLQNDLPYPPDEIYTMYHQILTQGTLVGIGFEKGVQAPGSHQMSMKKNAV
jgi:AcrR family transcriptional regulator